MNSSTSNSKRFFVAFVATFTLGITIFILGSEYFVRTAVVPNSQYDELRERLHTSHARYGAFADSRGANGLRSRKDFDQFSLAGDNLATIVGKAQFFVKRGFAKGIVLQADPHHFASYRLNRDQSSLREDLFSNDTPLLKFLRPPYRQYLLDYWQAYISEMVAPPRTDTDVASAHTMVRLSEQPSAEVDAAASIRAGLQTPVNTVHRTHFAQLYSKAIQELRSADINVCLVSFPVSSAYRQIISTEPSYANALNYYAEVAKQTGARYLDYTSLLEDDMFSDPDHLNEDGAQALTDAVLRNCFGLNQ